MGIIKPAFRLGFLALGLSLACVACQGGCGGSGKPRQTQTDGGEEADEDSEPSSSHLPRDVVALGRLEPAERVVDVGALPGDRLAGLKVAEGDQVDKGDPLAVLESRQLRELDLRAIEAQLAEAKTRRAAEAKLADARITSAAQAVEKVEAQQAEINAQGEKVDLLQASLSQAETEAGRSAELPENLVSKQERERQGLAVQQARADYHAAQALFDKMVLHHGLGKKAALADLESLRATRDQVLAAIPVESLSVSRELAEAHLERTVIQAPCTGVILKVFARRGELIGNAPILQMADLTRMAVVAEVYETDVGQVYPGQTAVVKSRALPNPYDRRGLRGTVARVGQIVSAPGLRAVDPFAPADRHVVEVRVELDEKNSRPAAHLTNLQVRVRFLARPAAATLDQSASSQE